MVTTHRSGEIVADANLMIKECGSHHSADGVTPRITRVGRAVAVSEPTGQGVEAARLQFCPEDVAL